MSKKKKLLIKTGILVIWLLIWQLITVMVHNDILLTGPVDVIKRLGKEIFETSFYRAVSGTIVRVLLGFLLGLMIGVLLGAVSYRYEMVKMFFAPVVSVMKSVPVAAIVVLILIWMGSDNLAVPISFVVVFPQIYISTITGLNEVTKEQKEMMHSFEMRFFNRCMYIYRPALMPYLINAVRISVGMGFKSGIAAEVIGIPVHSIGEALYMSKIYLDTSGVLAWTVVVLLISTIMEKLIVFLVKKAGNVYVRPMTGVRKQEEKDFSFEALDVTYDNGVQIKVPKVAARAGERLCIMGPSGCGKTTWLLATGKISGVKPAYVFQDNRLCMQCSAKDNVLMVCSSKKVSEVKELLTTLLPEEAIDKPVAEFSGGMRRKTVLARALLSGGNLLLLDEPFTGMDEESKRKAAECILKYAEGRTLIFATHNEEDMHILQSKNAGIF